MGFSQSLDEAADVWVDDSTIYTTIWIAGGSSVIQRRLSYQPTAPNTRGVPLTQANVNSLTLSIYDITNTNNPIVVAGFNGISLSVANCIFNMLQSWPVDNVGFNFATPLNTNAFPTSGDIYRVEVKYVATASAPITNVVNSGGVVAISVASPVGWETGLSVTITGTSTGLDGTTWPITVVNDTSFKLQGSNWQSSYAAATGLVTPAGLGTQPFTGYMLWQGPAQTIY